MRLLTTEDPFEAEIISEVANETMRQKMHMMEVQAQMIASEVGKMFK